MKTTTISTEDYGSRITTTKIIKAHGHAFRLTITMSDPTQKDDSEYEEQGSKLEHLGQEGWTTILDHETTPGTTYLAHKDLCWWEEDENDPNDPGHHKYQEWIDAADKKTTEAYERMVDLLYGPEEESK